MVLQVGLQLVARAVEKRQLRRNPEVVLEEEPDFPLVGFNQRISAGDAVVERQPYFERLEAREVERTEKIIFKIRAPRPIRAFNAGLHGQSLTQSRIQVAELVAAARVFGPVLGAATGEGVDHIDSNALAYRIGFVATAAQIESRFIDTPGSQSRELRDLDVPKTAARGVCPVRQPESSDSLVFTRIGLVSQIEREGMRIGNLVGIPDCRPTVDRGTGDAQRKLAVRQGGADRIDVLGPVVAELEVRRQSPRMTGPLRMKLACRSW